MKSDCKGALAQLDKSWKSFIHNGNRMTKPQVKAVLEYAVNGCSYTSGFVFHKTCV